MAKVDGRVRLGRPARASRCYAAGWVVWDSRLPDDGLFRTMGRSRGTTEETRWSARLPVAVPQTGMGEEA